ncbi:MAG: FkbM family methyltransferase [Candidatus Omnitrophota bacterium]
MSKIKINSKVITNWWDYYLVKWGIKKNAPIFLKTKPDSLKFILDTNILYYRRSLVKLILRLVKENRLKFYRESNEMLIFNAAKLINKKLKLDIMAIETVERLLNSHLSFEEFGQYLFIVDILKDTKILIRKHIISDIGVAEETFINDEYSILRPYLKDAVVLDIGAYIGDSGIKFALDGAKRVYSYEPHPELYDLAMKNIKLNNLISKITLKNFGVGDKRMNLTIKEDSYFGASSFFGIVNYQRCRNVELKISLLSSIIHEIGYIDVMKMDCEGAEFTAILFCPVESLRKIKIMLIEYHNEPESLINYLKKANFEVEIKKEAMVFNKKIGLLFAKLKEADE